MAQPFTATTRIMLPYTSNGLLHRAFLFCKAALDNGDWKLEDRELGVGTIPFDDAAGSFGGTFSEILPTGVTYGTIELQQKSGVQWNTVDVYTYSETPGNGNVVTCSQVTLTLRDTALYKVKAVLLDSVVSYPGQIATPTGGASNMDAFIGHFTGANDPAVDPWRWMVSRSNHFLNDNPFVACSITLSHQIESRKGF
jgi:hypothetical protein